MRPRSLSVACDKTDRMSKKFEGVTSDPEDDSDSDDEPVVVERNEFSFADFEKLVMRIRGVLPSNDTKKAEYRLKHLDWNSVAFDLHSPDSLRDVSLKLLKGIRMHRTVEEVLDDFLTKAKKSMLAGKPKKPLNAFTLYLKDRVSVYKQEHPELPHKDAFRNVIEEFKTLPIKKKRKYDQLAEEAKTAYKVELEKFYKDNPNAINPKYPKPSGSRRPPKRLTPFNLFLKEKRNEGLSLSRNELKALWEKLEFDEKISYVRQVYSIDKSTLNKEEKDMMATTLGKPDFVPRTALEYYTRKYAAKDSTISILAWRKQAALEFKKFSKVKKLELELEMRRARAHYVTQYQKYIDNVPPEQKQQEIANLQAYITNTMDKEDKKKYDGGHLPDLTGCGGHDMTDLPIAESTTNEIEPAKKKKSKKKAIPEPPANKKEPKTVKSILKSPARTPVVASPKRKPEDVEVSTKATPTKKKKADQVIVESESDSSIAKKGKKKAKKEKESDDGVDSSQQSLENGSRGNRIPKEPKRPPKDILKFYKKFHYFGREGKHKESFDKLSKMKKKAIECKMRAAQKKYMEDLRKYLDHLPPSEVKSYVKRLEQFVGHVGSPDDAESDDGDENVWTNTSLGKTKREPSSSDGDDDDDLSDD